MTVELRKLLVGHNEGVRSTSAIGLQVTNSESVVYKHSRMTDCDWTIPPRSHRAWCQIAESCLKLNSMFVCRHVVSEYFHLFFVLFVIVFVFWGLHSDS